LSKKLRAQAAGPVLTLQQKGETWEAGREKPSTTGNARGLVAKGPPATKETGNSSETNEGSNPVPHRRKNRYFGLKKKSPPRDRREEILMGGGSLFSWEKRGSGPRRLRMRKRTTGERERTKGGKDPRVFFQRDLGIKRPFWKFSTKTKGGSNFSQKKGNSFGLEKSETFFRGKEKNRRRPTFA